MTKAIRLWQKLLRLEVNPMADFFKELENVRWCEWQPL